PAVSLSKPFEDGLAGAETRSRPRLGARPIVYSGQGSSRQQKMAPKIAPRGNNSSITLSFYCRAEAQPRDALNPNHASTPATTQATQLAHTGTSTVPIAIGHPATARASCNIATIAKTIAAKRA